MITIISPAKTLDFDTPPTTQMATAPVFVAEAEPIIRKLRTLSKRKLMALMDISEDLAALNYERYAAWEPGVPVERSKQAILAFHGEVYLGLEAYNMEVTDLEAAQASLRILSGMYGLLRPLDLIQPHRLEMGTALPVGRRKNLYAYWRERVTGKLREAIMASEGDQLLVNLASQEYFTVVDTKALKLRVVTPVFKERKGADYKVVSVYAKRARGIMANWMISERVTAVEQLKEFKRAGYAFSAERSLGDEWVFVRDGLPV